MTGLNYTLVCLALAFAGLAGCGDGFSVGELDAAAADADSQDADSQDALDLDAMADATVRDGGVGDAPPRLDASQPDASQPDAPQLDASRLDAARMDVPAPVCTERPLPCLAPGTPRLVEVTTLEDIQDAAAGDILQLRGLRLGRAWLPPFTTLHGCEGAELTGLLFFDGGQSIVEGMTISGAGAIVATQTGNYIVRDNNFLCTNEEGCLEASARDGILGHQVTILVERNHFSGGRLGIRSSVRFSNMSRTVDIQVRNNIFDGVETPVQFSESGLTGAMTVVVEFNTFVDFEQAIDIFGVDSSLTLVRANLFAGGDTGIRSNVPYNAPLNMGWGMITPTSSPPIGGDLTIIPPAFEGDSYNLAPGALAIDAAGSTAPPDDFQGCLRPQGSAADVGALESD